MRTMIPHVQTQVCAQILTRKISGAGRLAVLAAEKQRNHQPLLPPINYYHNIQILKLSIAFHQAVDYLLSL